MKKFALTGIIAIALGMVVAAGSAQALHSSEHYSLFDDAAYSTPGNASLRAVTLTSDATPGWGGIDYGIATGTTFADIGVLATDYRFADGDSCGGGSPRFQIEVMSGSTTKNIFVYLGSSPSYTGCADETWLASGDLLQNGMTVDTSQLPGGTFYDTYENALAKYGTSTITGISLVADGGWAMDGSQIVMIDNTNVDGTVFTYEVADEEDEIAPDEPVHLSPANNSTLTSAAFTMSDWTDVMDESSPVTYRYESSHSAATTSDGSFASPIYESGVLASSSISTVGTPEGVYYWHVMAVDAESNESGWTDAWKVTIDNDATTTPPSTGGPSDKDQCKKGGWMDFTDPTFKNQGQCVSYFNKNR